MVYLKEIKEDDLYLLGKCRVNNKFLNRYSSEIRVNLEEEKRWLNKIMNDKLCKYWIIDIHNIKVGMININNIDMEKKECFLEYNIEDIHFKERDVIFNIIYNVCDYVFYKMNLDKIYCNVHRFDNFNIKLLKKIGNEIKDNMEYYNKDIVNMCIDKEKLETLKDKCFSENIYLYNKIMKID